LASAGYAVSKAGVVGMTKTIGTIEKGKGSNVLINSCCPGYVKTEMTRGGGSKTPDRGAQTPVMLALKDLNDRIGLFRQDEKPIQW
jgi:carbonyl reductase 1